MVSYFNRLSEIEGAYQRDELFSKIIFREEGEHNRFGVIERDSFWSFYNQLTNPHLHEVIYSWMPQKLKFDIDCPDVSLDVIQMLRKFIDVIVFETNAMFMGQVNVSDKNIILTDSSGSDKTSFHLIINGYAVDNCLIGKDLTLRVKNKLEKLGEFLDSGVNKRKQSFRIFGSTKLGSNRVKRKNSVLIEKLGLSNYTKEETLITSTSNCVMINYQIEQDVYNNMNVINDDLYDKIKDKLEKYLTDFEYRDSIGNILFFNRLNPSFCEICKRAHEKDNTLMIQVINNSIYELCRHDDKGEKKLIGYVEPYEQEFGEDEVETDECIKLWKPQNRIQAYINYLHHEYVDGVEEHTLFDELPDDQKTMYEDELIKPYKKHRVLVIKAPMKMGKTKKLREYIDTHFRDTEFKSYRILMISFRRTYTKNMKTRFQDFQTYDSIVGEIDEKYNRVIVQVESLHRVATKTPYDLVIIDECESNFDQITSELHKFGNASSAVAFWAMRFSKYLILMDANVSDRTYEILAHFRPNNKIHYQCNTYKNATKDVYYFTISSDRIIKEIYQCVDNSEPIGVICKTLLNANTIYKDLKDRYPKKNVKLYTSKTSNKVKEEEYGNVNKFWTEADVLIYTPTITAGLSYEVKHFRKLFLLFDTNEGCDINTCIQMSGRIRDVSDHQFYVLLKPTMRFYYPEKVSEVYDQMKTNRKLLFSSGLDFKFDNDGAICFYETDYFWLYIANQANRNKSYNDFNIRLIQRISSNGASIHYLDNEGSQNYLDIRKGTFLAKCDAIAGAKDITPTEAMAICEKLADNQDVETDELNSYEKFELKEFYKISSLSSKAVIILYPRSTHETFKRLTQMKLLGLDGIRNEEKDNFMRNMRNENKLIGESRDLNRNYEYQNHLIAHMIITSCGFNGLNDTNSISDLNLQRLDGLKQMIENNFGFRIRDSLRSRLMVVNKIIGKVYGAKIKRKKDEYRLELTLIEKLNEIGVVI